jgi:uncharacterized protein (TIGR02217 family)
MSGFRDVYLPDQIRGFPFTAAPRTSTKITQVKGGDENRNINWTRPLYRFNAPESVKCHEVIEDLRDHFLIMLGPAYTFPIRDPLNFATTRLSKANKIPSTGKTDQVIGIGDGLTRSFQLQKGYTRGGFTFTEDIVLPVLETVELGINALDISSGLLAGGPYTADVTRYGGEVLFDHAPHAGQIITWGGLFDREVRFEGDDSLDLIVQAFEVDGFADLSFWEVRFCKDEVGT